jgi:acyl-CoA dehydrogenase
MNFAFSDDAEALREQARRFLADKAERSRARKIMESDAQYDADLWRQVVELGWTGVRIPEAHGGLGLSHFELCVLAEEIGRAVAPIPFTSSVLLATELLLAHGSDAQKAKWLPMLADGSAIGTVAVAEDGAAGPNSSPKARCVSGALTGSKVPVADGMAATFALVATADGWVIADLANVAREPVDAVDLVRKQARLTFDGAPADLLLGDAAAITETYLQTAAVLTAFEALGSAEAAQAMAIDYAKTRNAFGRAIGSYQAIKHKCADMYIKCTLARGHALYGAWALHEGAAELPQAAAGARVAALDALRFCAEENVEIHGGIGFTWESDCQFFYRRARLLALQYGSRAYWADRLVRALEQRNRAAA